MSSLPVVLTFGLSDATGARGVQADQLACASMGCHPATVITAIVAAARDTGGDDWLAIDAELVEVQAKSVLQNMAVAAIKASPSVRGLLRPAARLKVPAC